MKVAWICHFSNHEIQSILHPGISDYEFVPWITNLAKLFENESSIELHIISKHNRISKYTQFVLRNIHYHFIPPHLILFGKCIALFRFDYRTNFIYLKYQIKIIIDKIKPDLIHLHGVEVDHSTTIFQFNNKYPILLTVQGFVSHATKKDDYSIKKRIKVEQKIFKKFRHFGYRTQTMGKDIKKYNPDAMLHWHDYPHNEIKLYNIEKKYDLVYFARVTKDKGIEDLLQAIAIIKKAKENISLCIIGGSNSIYIKYLKDIAEKLQISDNLFWAGLISKHEDVYRLAAAARISVLPTYNEIISFTIIESMFLKLAIVAYDVGSIHEVNNEEEIIFMVEKGDVSGLAEKILYLLKDSEELHLIGEKEYKRATKMFDNESIRNDLLNAYNLVKNDFNKK
jgi:glycosyltransferase involved in cell wall biosynthesis